MIIQFVLHGIKVISLKLSSTIVLNSRFSFPSPHATVVNPPRSSSGLEDIYSAVNGTPLTPPNNTQPLVTNTPPSPSPVDDAHQNLASALITQQTSTVTNLSLSHLLFSSSAHNSL